MSALHRIGKKLFFGRYQKPWRWPQQIAESDWDRVCFKSGNGARLAAVFGASARCRGKRIWLKQGHAELLRKSGFHVLAFDFNGFGESESANFDYAGHYLRDRVNAPVGVIGCSFGAGYAICANTR
jgi:uncharacterized protein